MTDSKLITHAELASLGMIEVEVLGELMPSKFKGKPPTIHLLIEEPVNGAYQTRYAPPNQSCGDFWTGLQGRRIKIAAQGDGKIAQILMLGVADGAPEPPDEIAGMAAPSADEIDPIDDDPNYVPGESSRKAMVTAPLAAPAGKRPAGTQAPVGLASVIEQAHNLGTLWVMAYETGIIARGKVRKEYREDLTAEQFQACVSSIFIALERRGADHLIVGSAGAKKVQDTVNRPAGPRSLSKDAAVGSAEAEWNKRHPTKAKQPAQSSPDEETGDGPIF